MAGGDGSQALVASLAVEHDLPFVCVSAGTRNHFALDLGLPRERPQRVYAGLPGRRSSDESTMRRSTTGSSSTTSLSASTRRSSSSPATGKPRWTRPRSFFPSFSGIRTNPSTFSSPRRMDERSTEHSSSWCRTTPTCLGASLDVSQRRTARHRPAGGLRGHRGHRDAGRLGRQPRARGQRGRRAARPTQFDCETFEVRSRSGKVFAGVDGEALELETPLRFSIHPAGLRMLVPDGNRDSALRRAAREVHVRDMVDLVTGREPTTG